MICQLDLESVSNQKHMLMLSSSILVPCQYLRSVAVLKSLLHFLAEGLDIIAWFVNF